MSVESIQKTFPIQWVHFVDKSKKIESELTSVRKDVSIPVNNNVPTLYLHRSYKITPDDYTLFNPNRYFELNLKTNEYSFPLKEVETTSSTQIKINFSLFADRLFQNSETAPQLSNSLDRLVCLSLTQGDDNFLSTPFKLSAKAKEKKLNKKRKAKELVVQENPAPITSLSYSQSPSFLAPSIPVRNDFVSINPLSVSIIFSSTLNESQKIEAKINSLEKKNGIPLHGDGTPILFNHRSYSILIEENNFINFIDTKNTFSLFAKTDTNTIEVLETEVKNRIQIVVKFQDFCNRLRKASQSTIGSWGLSKKPLQLSLKQNTHEFLSTPLWLLPRFDNQGPEKRARQHLEKTTQNKKRTTEQIVPEKDPTSTSVPLQAAPVSHPQPPIFPSSFTPVLNPNFSFSFVSNQHLIHHPFEPLITFSSSITPEQIQDFLANRTQIIDFHEITSPTATPASSSISDSAASSLGNSESEGAEVDGVVRPSSTLPITSTTATSVGNLPRSDTPAIFDDLYSLLPVDELQEILEQSRAGNG